ncbi:hypothetical protein ACHAQA_005776 [Verticillium albo-atrum]
MKFLNVIFALSALGPAQASPSSYGQKPPYFVLTGDSTVAVAGGWGDGFLALLKEPADGINPAKGGATTVSFRADGRWDIAIEAVKNNTGTHSPIVTIQFGHNDQKAASGISLAEFQANLVTLANEVIEAGGTPILITSLTRRAFNASGVIQNLNEHSAAAIAAAKDVGVQWLDLNKASTAYVNAIGLENSTYYDLAPKDRTHLNAAGEIVFGRLVADLLLQKRKDLGRYLKKNKALSAKLKAGEFATGEE